MIAYRKGNKVWINVAKAFSAGGVVLQHVEGYAYTDIDIFYSVWWAVALFVMIGGYNAMLSYENRGVVIVKKRIKEIVVPYLFATAVYVFYNNQFLNATKLLSHLIHFDATGPLYYVAVYIQLVLATPILCGIVQWCEEKNVVFRYMTAWLSILAVCYVTTHLTNIFDIALGGGSLFAGPWLSFWFLGMFVKRCSWKIGKKNYRIAVSTLNTGLILLWQYFFVNQGWNLILKPMFNGNQVRMTWANALETVLLFFWFKEVVGGIEIVSGEMGKKVLKPFDLMGRHTLYIFLYHMLFLSIYQNWFEIPGKINGWFCLAFIITCPVLLEIILRKIKKFFVDIMKEIKMV